MPHAGKIGTLPWPAWAAVAGTLSSPDEEPEPDRCASVLELRRTCKALAEVVGAGCVGGAGRLEVETAEESSRLEAGATAGLGRALVFVVRLPFDRPDLEEQEALARALVQAVERGHVVGFLGAHIYACAPAVTRMIESALIEASREGQLLDIFLDKGESLGWSVDAMAKFSVVKLTAPERETIATLVGGGALQRIGLSFANWADMSVLSSLREVILYCCAIKDLSPLADVPLLVISDCRIKALPAMRNDVLRVSLFDSLIDLSGLAGGRVGRLELQRLSAVEDVSAIGAMRPPPRTVILNQMYGVQDVSMLAGIHRLEVSRCRNLDKAATLAALKGKVGTILWE